MNDNTNLLIIYSQTPNKFHKIYNTPLHVYKKLSNVCKCVGNTGILGQYSTLLHIFRITYTIHKPV